MTGREASGSSGHSAGSSGIFGPAGQPSSLRSASAAAARPGAQQVPLLSVHAAALTLLLFGTSQCIGGMLR